MPTFRRTSVVPYPPHIVFAWHEQPGAFERLTPPWANVEVIERQGGIRNGATVSLRVKKGPIDVRWDLKHRDYEEGRQFTDEQVSGPLSSWIHHHRFEPTEDGGTEVIDELEWEPPGGAAAELFARPAVERELDRLFAFRHQRLRNDLDLHMRYADHPRITVAIAGMSGLIGSALAPLLTTGGHQVIPMSRTRSHPDPKAIYWSWPTGEVDTAALAPADAVVNLAGRSLFALRWTPELKKLMWDSRVRGTELLARTMGGLHSGPGTLVNASAVGYYGNSGDTILTEDSSRGKGFLADLCAAWEDATERADRSGIRVVKIRSGLVLSREGGALGTMLRPFKMGLGGRMGTGRQYYPWIDVDDQVGIIYHALMEAKVEGVLNATSPHPVPQATFASTLGRVLSRPAMVPLPRLAIRSLFGEMGKELFLQGQRAKPERTIESGYEFLMPGLEDSLRYQLGKTSPSSSSAG